MPLASTQYRYTKGDASPKSENTSAIPNNRFIVNENMAEDFCTLARFGFGEMRNSPAFFAITLGIL